MQSTPEEMPAPRRWHVLPPQRRQTVLLTGGSGVVGAALLTRLRQVDVICLVHRNPVCHGGVISVFGDLTKPALGLPEGEYRALADRVDAVIHCAAVTDFNRTAATESGRSG